MAYAPILLHKEASYSYDPILKSSTNDSLEIRYRARCSPAHVQFNIISLISGIILSTSSLHREVPALRTDA